VAAPFGHAGGGSGGYLHHVFRHAALALFGVADAPVTLRRVRERSEDFQVAVLKVGSGRERRTDGSWCAQVGEKDVLRFALAYGFRNIQNVVRQIKQGKSAYDFVEIMACPSGACCLVSLRAWFLSSHAGLCRV
jgi:iron only hydrogenase large subunit-like protein